MSLQPEEKYNFDFELQLNRWSMRLLGLWPLEEDLLSKIRLHLSVLCVMTITIPIIIQFFSSIDFFKDIQNVLLLMNLISTVCKLVLISYHKQHLKILLEDMIIDWNDIQFRVSKKHQCIMISQSRRGRVLNALNLIFMYIPTNIYLVWPLLQFGENSLDQLKRSLPCKVNYPIDIEKLPNYALLYISQVISVNCVSIAIIAVNTFLAIIVFHLCGQLQIVTQNVQHISDTRNNTINLNCMNNLITKRLCLIVKRHIELIRNFAIIENAFSIMILIEVICTVISLCILAFTIVVISPITNFYDVLANMAYFTASLFNIFLYCYIGESIIDISTGIGRQVYDINWYDHNPKLVRSLMLILIRSQRQLELTSGKFFPMSFHAFKQIFMSAMSYASVLLALKQKL